MNLRDLKLGMVLACLGLYGLTAYEVTRRTAEIGIRLALGAQPESAAESNSNTARGLISEAPFGRFLGN